MPWCVLPQRGHLIIPPCIDGGTFNFCAALTLDSLVIVSCGTSCRFTSRVRVNLSSTGAAASTGPSVTAARKPTAPTAAAVFIGDNAAAGILDCTVGLVVIRIGRTAAHRSENPDPFLDLVDVYLSNL